MFKAIKDIDSFLSRLVLGDHEAWSTLMKEGERDLIKVYLAFGFTDWEAKELWDRSVHKLFIQRFAKYDPNKGSLEWWVKTIARNVGLDEWRRRKRRRERPLDFISLSETRKSLTTEISSEICAHVQGYCTCAEEKEGGASELSSLVATALSLLSESDQDVLWKRYVDNLPFDVIAERFGISEPATRMRLSRALKGFKVQMERLSPREQRRRIERPRRRHAVGATPPH